eukprot:TRINITY_DN51247_c0_g1_i1.p1 TRINITY_DN51247_c0_g1~~TRINITY_DN51247_c0_g1_i1.p1  ORF type:complete len:266 (+),score=25.83 TRINITY_DN51247_c0_g1_i1:161-958(+)
MGVKVLYTYRLIILQSKILGQKSHRIKGEVLMKKFVLMMVTTVMFMGFIFATASEGAEVIRDLSGWKGVNMSTTNILSGTRKNMYASEIAQYKEGYNAQMVQIFIDKMYYSTFFTWEVLEDGKTIIFDNMYKGEYDFVGSLSTMWSGYDLVWYIFKTDSEEAINAGYKYLALFPYHGHGEGAPHMHMRYGNANFAYLTTDPSLDVWWPTCYKAANMDQEALFNELMSGAKMMTTMLPDIKQASFCLLYTSPSPRDLSTSRMPSSA